MFVETFKIDPAGDPASWHRLRGRDVTASVAAALLGVHPYKSRYALWNEKAGRHVEPVEETEAMVRGKLLEPVAIELLKRQRPDWKVWQPNVYLRDEESRLGATPDAFAVDPAREGAGIVQVKSVERGTFRRKWVGDDGDVEVPLWIATQAILEAHLAGATWAAVAVLVFDFGLKLELIDIPIHAGVIKRLRDEAAAFWRSIEANEPPPPDYGVDGALLAGIFADDNGREIDLSGDNMLPALLEERETLRERMSADEARINEIEAEIIHKIGDHERAYLPGWSVKRSRVSRRGYYVEPTQYRRLTIRRLA